MLKAAIYCRVSTDAQELEGTSLQTQLESCLRYCQDKGYDVPIAYQFSEAKSGLTLDRPKLEEVRELIRNESIDVLVVHALDRLSRDPSHGVVLIDEREKHGVTLEAVTETVESTELGKLISYIRGFASKVEAEKIKERTARGRKAKAKNGGIPNGGFSSCYGYDYEKTVKGQTLGRRTINEDEAKIVRNIFKWYVEDGMSTYTIATKLRNSGIPTKRGGLWCHAGILNILGNTSYIGKAYAYTCSGKHQQYKRDRADWIELPCPQIIPVETFESAQKQRKMNFKESKRNVKYQYLLRSHIRCKQCGHAYYGETHGVKSRATGESQQTYRCSGKLNHVGAHCTNRSWISDRLDNLVWAKLEKIIREPETIISEIKKQQTDIKEIANNENEIKNIDRKLKALDREQAEQFKYAKMGFPETAIINENKRINAERENLQLQRIDLEIRIKSGQKAALNQDKIKWFLGVIQSRMDNLDFNKKRLILDALDITVWLDGNKIRITGSIGDDIETKQSCLSSYNLKFSVEV